ncbi:transglycosylase domain-containing protein [Heyndrickxia sp. NPDC080065]|uniref:transglycosylase domain-containing protein n=1 Tax=Heyndrickxia sp. NPDC080065 TaxID=3390568 RepID=UPI003D0958EE
MPETNQTREEYKLSMKRKKNSRSNSLAKSVLIKLFLGCLIFGFISLGIVVVIFLAIIKDAPELDKSKLADPLSTKFYDKNGKFVHEYGMEKRTKITYQQVPKVLEQAVIATEDGRFYSHHGIDVKRTAKAIFENITNGFGSQGGSTITQQVIKNSFLSPEKTTKRKIQEWYLAYKLEEEYSKHEILIMYLNKINFGNGSYGVAAAAKSYYGLDVKDLKKMTLAEAATLAGLPQSPNNYDPSKPENKKAAEQRRNIVLKSMNRQGYITKKQMLDAMNISVTKGIIKNKQKGMPYEGFLDAAVREVESKLKNVDISTDGLQIYLTLDPEIQQYADELANSKKFIDYPNERFQTAFTFMDSRTGEVRAIGSGRNKYKATFRGNNLVIDSKLQPGSTFKPIFDYAPAIEKLKWSTYHQVVDEPYHYSNGDPIRNAYKNYSGSMSIRNALVESRNIPALKTLQQVGLNEAKNFAKSLGITFPNDQVYESFAIGSNPVSTLQLAGAYGAFANKGMYTKPHFVTKVVLSNGKTISFKPKSKRVMEDYTAYMITDILRGVIHAPNGTGHSADIPGLDIAGKTGTTNFDLNTTRKFGFPESATNDSWFAGYTPNYTMTVWTGYPRINFGNYMAGETTKISHFIFKSMIQRFETGKSHFEQPPTVEKIRNELYIKGVNPDMLPPAPKPKKKKEQWEKDKKHHKPKHEKEKHKKKGKKHKGKKKH